MEVFFWTFYNCNRAILDRQISPIIVWKILDKKIKDLKKNAFAFNSSVNNINGKLWDLKTQTNILRLKTVDWL